MEKSQWRYCDSISMLFMNLVLAFNAFNCVSSRDFLLHSSCLNAQTICSAQMKTATHYRTQSPKCYMLISVWSFSMARVPAFIFSVKDGKPSAIKFLSHHLILSDSHLHLLPHRREKEVSSPNPLPYSTLITMINFPLFNLKAAQLALIPQLPSNTSPLQGLVELSLLRTNACPRSDHSYLDPPALAVPRYSGSHSSHRNLEPHECSFMSTK